MDRKETQIQVELLVNQTYMNETELLEKIISKLSTIEFQLMVINLAAWITAITLLVRMK